MVACVEKIQDGKTHPFSILFTLLLSFQGLLSSNKQNVHIVALVKVDEADFVDGSIARVVDVVDGDVAAVAAHYISRVLPIVVQVLEVNILEIQHADFIN